MVDPPRRLVYTFEWEEPDPDDQETLVTLSFSDHREGTKLIVDQGPFANEARYALDGRQVGQKRSSGSPGFSRDSAQSTSAHIRPRGYVSRAAALGLRPRHTRAYARIQAPTQPTRSRRWGYPLYLCTTCACACARGRGWAPEPRLASATRPRSPVAVKGGG